MNKLFRVLIKPIRLINKLAKYWFVRSRQLSTIDEICDLHFKLWSFEDHINRSGLTKALNEMKQDAPIIFETGTSAYGVDSSRLFDQVVTRNSGKFISVDINSQPSKSLLFQHSRRSNFYVDDSVNFIDSTLKSLIDHIDLCYLDSWDVDWSDPLPSAEHGLREFDAVRSFLFPGSILVIDDTPSDLELIPSPNRATAIEFESKYGVLPGKGAFIVKLLQSEGFAEVISHEYNLVCRIN